MDIVIHAPPQSGSLLRLLRSIEGADYFGSRRPHITIELPAEIDTPTLDFLEDFVWPPLDSGAHASQVTLRHRIPRHSFNAEEASSHMLESFYPATKDSHVLLITPQAELSPVYYHYVMYNLLEYKYSTLGQRSESKNLMGLSLELPYFYLNGTQDFDPPMFQHDNPAREPEPTQFLWQAPNSNAALYFGEKWVELHSFFSARISLQDPRLPAKKRSPTREKLISTAYPSWMEYVQELMRARGYSLLYPNFANTEDAIVTVHEEHYQPPEEYSKTRSHSAPLPTLDPDDPFTTDPDLAAIIPVQSEPLLGSNLDSLLPWAGDLPKLVNLPILSYEGNPISRSTSTSAAKNFADQFRHEIGRCSKAKVIEPMSARDLFCNLDDLDTVDADDNIDSVETKEEENEKTENKLEEKTPKKIEKARQEQTPLKDESADNGRVQDEFSAHLQRQGGKVHKPSTTRHRGDDKSPPGETRQPNEVEKSSEKVEKDKDEKSDSGAVRNENANDEKSKESVTKQDEKRPNKDDQATRAKVGGGVKGGNEPAAKDTSEKATKKPSEDSKNADAGTEKSSTPTKKLDKEQEKPSAEVVRDRGW